MGSTGSVFFNYAQLLRLSNLPTCLANGLTGAAIGMQFEALNVTKLVALVVVISCYYCGGMILNDLCDLSYDRLHRSERPLVSGVISYCAALVVTGVLFISGTAILYVVAAHALVVAALLLLFIILYDLLHKKYSASVVLMGGCRALVYMTCAVAVAAPSEAMAVLLKSLPFAMLLGFYTLSITLVARMENQPRLDYRKWLSVVMPLVLIGVLFFVRPTQVFYAVMAGVVLSLWMIRGCRFVFVRPPKIKLSILTWLSGMCLVDVWFLTVLDRPVLAIFAGVCFVITVYGHKRISGT
ncbi:MAG: UbiA family prenyltransferase [Phycisphaerae bacterium]|nr:UbiA family prenyltransferase [Phycisphaerae bacterium]